MGNEDHGNAHTKKGRGKRRECQERWGSEEAGKEEMVIVFHGVNICCTPAAELSRWLCPDSETRTGG